MDKPNLNLDIDDDDNDEQDDNFLEQAKKVSVNKLGLSLQHTGDMNESQVAEMKEKLFDDYNPNASRRGMKDMEGANKTL